MYRLLSLTKNDAEICDNLATWVYGVTVSGSLAFHFCGPLGRRQEGYLPVLRLYEEQAQRPEYKWGGGGGGRDR